MGFGSGYRVQISIMIGVSARVGVTFNVRVSSLEQLSKEQMSYVLYYVSFLGVLLRQKFNNLKTNELTTQPYQSRWALCSMTIFKWPNYQWKIGYANLLRQLRKTIKSKRPGKLKKGVLFHQDNAAALKSVVAMFDVRDCGFELVDHPPYSPDLAPSHYFLFPNMKKHLAGKQYTTNDEVISAVDEFLRIRMRASIPRESSTATSMEKCMDH